MPSLSFPLIVLSLTSSTIFFTVAQSNEETKYRQERHRERVLNRTTTPRPKPIQDNITLDECREAFLIHLAVNVVYQFRDMMEEIRTKIDSWVKTCNWWFEIIPGKQMLKKLDEAIEYTNELINPDAVRYAVCSKLDSVNLTAAVPDWSFVPDEFLNSCSSSTPRCDGNYTGLQESETA